ISAQTTRNSKAALEASGPRRMFDVRLSEPAPLLTSGQPWRRRSSSRIDRRGRQIGFQSYVSTFPSEFQDRVGSRCILAHMRQIYSRLRGQEETALVWMPSIFRREQRT